MAVYEQFFESNLTERAPGLSGHQLDRLLREAWAQGHIAGGHEMQQRGNEAVREAVAERDRVVGKAKGFARDLMHLASEIRTDLRDESTDDAIDWRKHAEDVAASIVDLGGRLGKIDSLGSDALPL